MMYQVHVNSLEGAKKREFLVECEDVQGLRDFDRKSTSKETDLSTGSAK